MSLLLFQGPCAIYPTSGKFQASTLSNNMYLESWNDTNELRQHENYFAIFATQTQKHPSTFPPKVG